MSGGERIFRKVALERLSSPEQLDQLMQVTNPRGWLALAAIGALLLAVVVWSFTGSIPTEAVGEGILIRSGGLSDLVVTGQGQVQAVLVSVDDVVERGQVVATLRQDELQRRIDDARARREAAIEEYRALVQFASEQRRLSARNLAQKRANLERSIEVLARDLEIVRERRQAERSLLADGLITKQTLLATEQELNAGEDRLATLRLELAGLELTRLEAEQALDEQIEARQRESDALAREVGDLQAKLEENANVVSIHDGRVLELAVEAGDVVSAGDSILTMEVTSDELMAVLFVPASDGKRVRPGMPARISPSTVKPEEYGYMLGEVSWVAEFPSTFRGMTRLLANEELVQNLMDEGPPIQIDVVLRRDPATPSGYRWSSSQGPELPISSGTLAGGSVIVRRERPINLVIPKIREELGI